MASSGNVEIGKKTRHITSSIPHTRGASATTTRRLNVGRLRAKRARQAFASEVSHACPHARTCAHSHARPYTRAIATAAARDHTQASLQLFALCEAAGLEILLFYFPRLDNWTAAEIKWLIFPGRLCASWGGAHDAVRSTEKATKVELFKRAWLSMKARRQFTCLAVGCMDKPRSTHATREHHERTTYVARTHTQLHAAKRGLGHTERRSNANVPHGGCANIVRLLCR